MGAEERQPLADLKEALAPFSSNARRYAFYRLIYLLERSVGGKQIGQLGPPSEERIRLRPDPGLVFHSSDVMEVEAHKSPDDVLRARVTTTFMGLYGSTSPLPPHFMEQIALDDFQGGPQPIREFFDVFHHRLLSLVYRSWSKYRFSATFRRHGDDPFTRRLLCTAGIDGFREYPTALSRFFHLRYAPALASKSRSARGLEVVLRDLFGEMGVRLEQFVGHWTKIEKPLRNKVGVMNCRLGEDLTIGRYVYDGTGRFTVVLGPLGYDEYLSFLPGGRRRKEMRAVVDTFTRGMYDVMLELHVKTDAAPRFQLGSPRASTLKRTAWLGGSGGQAFVLTVPLDEAKAQGLDEDDDDPDDRGEPPPL